MSVLMEVLGTFRPLSDRKFQEFTDRYAAEPELLSKRGMELVGGFRRTGGRSHQLLHLYRFESVAAWDEAYNETLKWDAGYLARRAVMNQAMDDGGGKGSSKVGRWTNLARMVPPGTDEMLDAAMQERPDTPRQYMETTVTLFHAGSPEDGNYDEAFELIGRVCEESAAKGGFRLVSAYQRMFADTYQVVVLGISPAGSPPTGYTMATASPPLNKRLQEIVVDESMVLLNPFTYSPLQ